MLWGHMAVAIVAFLAYGWWADRNDDIAFSQWKDAGRYVWTASLMLVFTHAIMSIAFLLMSVIANEVGAR